MADIKIERRDKKKWMALRETVATVERETGEKVKVSRPLNGAGFFFEFQDEVLVITLQTLVDAIMEFKDANPFPLQVEERVEK